MSLGLSPGTTTTDAAARVRRQPSLKHTHHIAHGRAVKGLTMFNPLAVAQVPSCPPEQYTHHTGHRTLKSAKMDHFACVAMCAHRCVSNEMHNQAVDARGKRQYRFNPSSWEIPNGDAGHPRDYATL